jgi:hypothetical protein
MGMGLVVGVSQPTSRAMKASPVNMKLRLIESSPSFAYRQLSTVELRFGNRFVPVEKCPSSGRVFDANDWTGKFRETVLNS